MSHSLVLQLEQSGGFSDSDPVGDGAVDTDPLRKVAGVGVLMQQAQPGGATATFDTHWHALNVASLSASDATSSHLRRGSRHRAGGRPRAGPVSRRGAGKPSSRMTVTPSAPGACSPASRSSRALASPPRAPRTIPPRPRSAMTLLPTWPRSPGRCFPALKYGQVYNILPYLVGNSGALPKELARAHPRPAPGRQQPPESPRQGPQRLPPTGRLPPPRGDRAASAHGHRGLESRSSPPAGEIGPGLPRRRGPARRASLS